MTEPAHPLDYLHALAGVVARGDISARALAFLTGPARDPFGRGDQWVVEPPDLPGVHGLVVIAREGDGPTPSIGEGPIADLVMVRYARGTGPTLREVEARLGPSEPIAPLDWEPHRACIAGPVWPGARVVVIVTTDAEPDHDLDARVTDIALRRDRV